MEQDKLTKVRAQIDEIDKELCRLFEARMEVAREAARCKLEQDMPVYAPAREREILVSRSREVKPELSGYARVLYATLFDLSRSYQSALMTKNFSMIKEIEDAIASSPERLPSEATVACQGVEGAYSQLACDRLFSLANILYFNRFDGVFRAVEQGLCHYGILPVENSIHGTVTEVYDLMKQYDFHIVKSLRMRINHCLLALPGATLSGIKEVFSHEQALGQCGNFLKTLKGANVTSVENTASAAKILAESKRRDAAVIASREAAAAYGLVPLTDNISNSDGNFTRFILIAKDLEVLPGANRISLMLSTEHKPGALYRVLARFAALGYNLTKLESRPVPGSDFEFLFYADVEASVRDEDARNLLADLKQSQPRCDLLGCYMEECV